MGCKICNGGRIGYKWDRDLRLGTKKPREAALQFKMELDEVLEHLESHMMKVPPAEDVELERIITDPEYLLQKSAKILLQIEDWITIVREVDNISIQEISQGAKLLKEYRDTLKFVAELQGKLNKGDTYHQQFVQIQGDYNQFTSNVLETVCPDCQAKLLKKMNTLQLKTLNE
jgi:hypothetical protein